MPQLSCTLRSLARIRLGFESTSANSSAGSSTCPRPCRRSIGTGELRVSGFGHLRRRDRSPRWRRRRCGLCEPRRLLRGCPECRGGGAARRGARGITGHGSSHVTEWSGGWALQGPRRHSDGRRWGRLTRSGYGSSLGQQRAQRGVAYGSKLSKWPLCGDSLPTPVSPEEPDRRPSVAGCRIGGMPFVVGVEAVVGTARS
jgi:hypothetical protein